MRVSSVIKQRILGFHQDDEGHWVADLSCGHSQHMRHNPPWMLRPWVLTEGERGSRIGTEIECQLCEDERNNMKPYMNPGPSVEEVESLKGIYFLEFGTDWCGHCRAAAPIIEEALAGTSESSHIKVEDGKGRRLGRAFKVKLWPTLIILKDGKEQARFVRPDSSKEITRSIQEVPASNLHG